MTEAEFQQQVTTLARTLGYRCVHHRPGKSKAGRWSTPTTEIGWPDLTLVRPPRLLFIELKGTDTPVRAGQVEFLALLDECGCEAHLWRAGEITLQQIADILAPKVAA